MLPVLLLVRVNCVTSAAAGLCVNCVTSAAAGHTPTALPALYMCLPLCLYFIVSSLIATCEQCFTAVSSQVVKLSPIWFFFFFRVTVGTEAGVIVLRPSYEAQPIVLNPQCVLLFVC